MNQIAFNAGYEAAKSGCHISNCFPFTKYPYNHYWDWIDGYNSYKSN